MPQPTEDPIAKRFRRDTAHHELTILHDDGLYRHLRLRNPRTSVYWFDLVTWPGSLAIRGDIEGHIFSREPDMFPFFRSKYGINAHYWAEKTEHGREPLKEYSEDLFRQLVTEHVAEAIRYSGAPRGIGKAVRAEILDSSELHYEDGAREVLNDFDYKGFRFEDTWEWSFREYSWSYLWCCHAIQFGIAQYDRARVAEAHRVSRRRIRDARRTALAGARR